MSKEFDPAGADPKTNGAKLDGGKVPVFQGALDYFPRALAAVAAVSAKGAAKYAWKGWETVPDGRNRYLNAQGRHLLAMGRGEIMDDGPGGINEPHAAQNAWNALAVLELFLRGLEDDARRESERASEEAAKGTSRVLAHASSKRTRKSRA